jgi:hypothetical protein
VYNLKGFCESREHITFILASLRPQCPNSGNQDRLRVRRFDRLLFWLGNNRHTFSRYTQESIDRSQAIALNVHILDVFPVLCPEDVCRLYNNQGVFLYRSRSASSRWARKRSRHAQSPPRHRLGVTTPVCRPVMRCPAEPMRPRFLMSMWDRERDWMRPKAGHSMVQNSRSMQLRRRRERRQIGKNNLAQLLDRSVNANPKTKPWMPPVQQFVKLRSLSVPHALL